MTRRPRLLLVTPAPPAPANAGDRQRTALLLRALEQVATVDVLTVGVLPADDLAATAAACQYVGNVEPAGASARGPWRLLRSVLGARRADRIAHNAGDYGRLVESANPPVAAAVDRLERERGAYDAIVCRYLPTAGAVGRLGDGRTRVIVDVDDLPTEVYASRLAGEAMGRAARAIVGRHLRALGPAQARMMGRASWLWFVTAEHLARAPDPSRASLLPNLPGPGVDAPRPTASPPDSATALFVGSLSHRPNARAVERLVARIWPRVLAARPDARLRIIGRGLGPAAAADWSARPGVEVVGYVDSLDPHYAAAALTVAPLTEGSGTNIKVLESYLMGRACVLTTVACRGYGDVLVDGQTAAIADDDEGLAAAVVRLLGDPAGRDAMAAAGQRAVRERFSFAPFAAEVRRTLEASLSTPPPPR